MSRLKPLLAVFGTAGGALFVVALLVFVLLFFGWYFLLPFVLILMLVYGWMLYAFLHYRQGRQEEVLMLLGTAAEAQAPLAPALWAYLRDRPHGTLREFWTALLLFFVFPGYYWVWHRRHSFDRKVARVAYVLEAGESLPWALRCAPGVVSAEMALAVQIGEHTGRLAYCLRSSLPKRIGPPLVELVPRFLYPLFLLLFVTAILAFWITAVLPRLQRIFADFAFELPQPTQKLVALSEDLTGMGYTAGTSLVLIFLVVLWLLLFLALLLTSSTVRWYTPGVALVYRRHVRGRVLKMLAVLFGAQTPAPEALALLADSAYFAPVARRRLRVAAERVAQGEPLADSLRRVGLLPRSMAALVQASERTQHLAWSLSELGDLLADRALRGLRRLSLLLSPAFVVAVGAVVGFVVIGLFMPLVEIISRLTE